MPRHLLRRAGIASALLLALLAVSRTGAGMTLTVNSTGDTVAADGVCTLREAVANIGAGSAVHAGCNPAGAWGNNDAIVFNLGATPGTITLTAPIVLAKAVQIIGTGNRGDVVIDGAGAGVQLFQVPSGGTGTVMIYNLHFTRGGKTGFNGGALWVDTGRTAVLQNCLFSQNSPPAPSAGGAVANYGSLVVNDTTFSGNSCSGAAGALINGGSLIVSGSVFTGNQQTGPGTGAGAIYLDTGSTFSLADSTFSGNGSGNAGGGAVVATGASGTIGSCTFSANSTTGNGGAAVLNAAAGQSIAVQNSTFSGNQAAPTGWGGAIYVNGGAVDLRNVTVTANQALMGGGLFVGGSGATLQIRNSLVAGNSSVAGGSDPDLIVWPGNSMASADYNLFGTCTSCTLAAHDQTSVSPGLGPLADNGGPAFGIPAYPPTFTHLPSPGSPAVDGGDPAGCRTVQGSILAVDQRGATRPYASTRCDVGAVEVQAPAAAASKLAFSQQPTNAAAGASIAPAVTVQLQDAGGNPVAQPGVSVALALATGTGTLSGTASQVTNASGLATFAGLSLDLAGTKSLSAAAPGLAPATSSPFVVSAGAPAHLAVTSGNGQSAQTGAAFAAPLQVTVTDAFGNPVPGAVVTFTPPISGAGALLAGSPAATNASGVASVTATANATIGSYQVSASVGTLPPAAFDLTNFLAAPTSVPALGGLGLLALSALLASAGVAFLTTRR